MSKRGAAAPEVVEDPVVLLALAHRTLRLTGVELARLLDISPRTLHRWFARRTSVTAVTLADIVPHLYPLDPQLAARVHAYCTMRLASVGLPPPPPLPVPQPGAAEPQGTAGGAPSVPALPSATDEMRVDSVVYAACEVIDAPSRAVGAVVLAAFRRAGQLGLSIADVERELAGRAKRAKKRGS